MDFFKHPIPEYIIKAKLRLMDDVHTLSKRKRKDL